MLSCVLPARAPRGPRSSSPGGCSPGGGFPGGGASLGAGLFPGAEPTGAGLPLGAGLPGGGAAGTAEPGKLPPRAPPPSWEPRGLGGRPPCRPGTVSGSGRRAPRRSRVGPEGLGGGGCGSSERRGCADREGEGTPPTAGHSRPSSAWEGAARRWRLSSHTRAQCSGTPAPGPPTRGPVGFSSFAVWIMVGGAPRRMSECPGVRLRGGGRVQAAPGPARADSCLSPH